MGLGVVVLAVVVAVDDPSISKCAAHDFELQQITCKH